MWCPLVHACANLSPGGMRFFFLILSTALTCHTGSLPECLAPNWPDGGSDAGDHEVFAALELDVFKHWSCLFCMELDLACCVFLYKPSSCRRWRSSPGILGPLTLKLLQVGGTEIKFVLTFPPLLQAGLTPPPAGKQLVINCNVVSKGRPD